MKSNKLTIQIEKPVNEVFVFTTTPPNSTRWIPGVIGEETNELPIRVGTIYTLQTVKYRFAVSVATIKENEVVEWVSENGTYHCQYTYKACGDEATELTYEEWTDEGELDNPFTLEILNKLKIALEM